MQRNRNRGVVLRLSDAAAIHRMLELWLDDRRFDNPIVATETQRAARAAKIRLEQKLVAVFAWADEGDDSLRIMNDAGH